MRYWLTAVLVIMALPVLADEEKPAKEKKPAPVVIPFDFDTSQFENEEDEGEYSKKMGFMFWKKIERKGQFVIPESMLEVRDVCRQLDLKPTADTSLVKMMETVKEHFEAQIGIWGRLDRLGEDRYEIWIKMVDFSGDEPDVIADVHGITKTVHEIPHKFVAGAIMKLYKEKAPIPPGPDPEEERLWQEGPNLVANGDFETLGAKGWPRYWDDHPMPPNKPGCEVRRVKAPNRDGACMQLKMTKQIGDSYGVAYYSFHFPIQAYAKYRFQCRYRTTGVAVKVFLKAYDEMVEVSPDGKKELWRQYREVYRNQQNLYEGKDGWSVQTEDFTPRHTKYTPRKMRVMLYGYNGAGSVYFDDVVIKLIKPAPVNLAKQDRRHSLESKVKLKEYEHEHAKYREHKAGTKGRLKDVSTGANAPEIRKRDKPVDDVEVEGD